MAIDLIFLNHLRPVTDQVSPWIDVFRPFGLLTQHITMPYFGADLSGMDATVSSFIVLYVGHAFVLSYVLAWVDNKTGLHPARLHSLTTQLLQLARSAYQFCVAACLISAVFCAGLGIFRDVVIKSGPLSLFQANAGIYAKSSLFSEAADQLVQVMYLSTFLDMFFSILLDGKGLSNLSEKEHLRNVGTPLVFAAAHAARADFMWVFVLSNGLDMMLDRCNDFNGSNRDFLSKTLSLPKEISDIQIPFVDEISKFRSGVTGINGFPK